MIVRYSTIVGLRLLLHFILPLFMVVELSWTNQAIICLHHIHLLIAVKLKIDDLIILSILLD